MVLFAVTANAYDICSCCDLWQLRRSFAERKFPRIRKSDGSACSTVLLAVTAPSMTTIYCDSLSFTRAPQIGRKY
jgi:hypothetical protein